MTLVFAPNDQTVVDLDKGNCAADRPIAGPMSLTTIRSDWRSWLRSQHHVYEPPSDANPCDPLGVMQAVQPDCQVGRRVSVGITANRLAASRHVRAKDPKRGERVARSSKSRALRVSRTHTTIRASTSPHS